MHQTTRYNPDLPTSPTNTPFRAPDGSHEGGATMISPAAILLLFGAPSMWGQWLQPPPDLAELTTKARLNGHILSYCSAEFVKGQKGAYAVAVVSPDGVRRYVALHPDGMMQELIPFSGRGELSCYTRAEAVKLDATVQKSDTIEGSIEPQFDTTVVCTFVDDTTARCWQYSPDARDFVGVGRWTT
jgi:hypothetical protein